MLHITNGDSAAGTIQDAVFSGQILAWRDILHEGPVPAGQTLPQLSQVRAAFIAAQGWGSPTDVTKSFIERDEVLARFREHEEIVLWFEHDLYDQLQLLQILGWFYNRERGATKLSLICIGEHPDVHPFHGLGQLTSIQLAALFPQRHAVKPKELQTAAQGWHAFTSPNPTAIETLLATGTAALPFLKNALLRHLQQFPSTRHGLSRSEQQILTVVAAGHRTPGEMFQADQALEEAIFMGDATYFDYVKRLCEGTVPLLQTESGANFCAFSEQPETDFFSQRLVLTEAGRAVLAGEADHLSLNGIDRWLGGVHLASGGPLWRWDGQRLVAE